KVSDGSVLWTDQYTKTIANVASMPVDISRDISAQLRARLSGEAQNRVAKKLTENSEAYDLYLKGQFFFFKLTKEGYEQSQDYFRQAVEKDPNFADAWAYYGDSYGAIAFEGYGTPSEFIPKARKFVEKSLALDPSNGHAHLSMGGIYLQEWNFKQAEAEF